RRFAALTSYRPMRWQARLFDRFMSGDVPETCDLPTGLGKTSTITIWLLSLVQQVEDGGLRLPRRLAYIVNRRTVVDQATETVEEIRDRLRNPDRWPEYADELETIREALCNLSSDADVPLALSTLRGELADNEEWKVDPA